MTSWVVKIGKETPEHWGFARDDRLWDVRRPGFFGRIEPGDDVYFWLAKTGLVSWVRATTSLYPIGPHSRPARWVDNHLGQYTHRFEFEVISDDVPHLAVWEELRTAGGKKYAAQSPANEITEPNAELFLRAQFGKQSDVAFVDVPVSYTPGADMRERAERQITLRRGQARFRNRLIIAYAGKCAVTGSTVTSVLEAAHIDRYYGDHTNHVTNRLLLRSDIHTLFDLRLLTVSDATTVLLAPWLRNSEYKPLHGKTLQLPDSSTAHPDTHALARHRESCEWA
ncbi:HNH endonuclease [Rhodococcus spelaei]|uniref:HNH endonuclease n=1 Tax=Rhodococcus spelaei TaxID=2546320 RepID=A0A541B0F7_9NOCA|nr:HNH endonuclease [Rhodococcus spelaei]TQF65790.1 HNH endonuclease [Rhodococcus spelaei]